MDGLCSGRVGKADRNFSITTRSDLETQMMAQLQEVSKSVEDLAERIGPVQTDSAGQMQSIGTQNGNSAVTNLPAHKGFIRIF